MFILLIFLCASMSLHSAAPRAFNNDREASDIAKLFVDQSIMRSWERASQDSKTYSIDRIELFKTLMSPSRQEAPITACTNALLNVNGFHYQFPTQELYIDLFCKGFGLRYNKDDMPEALFKKAAHLLHPVLKENTFSLLSNSFARFNTGVLQWTLTQTETSPDIVQSWKANITFPVMPFKVFIMHNQVPMIKKIGESIQDEVKKLEIQIAEIENRTDLAPDLLHVSRKLQKEKVKLEEEIQKLEAKQTRLLEAKLARKGQQEVCAKKEVAEDKEGTLKKRTNKKAEFHKIGRSHPNIYHIRGLARTRWRLKTLSKFIEQAALPQPAKQASIPQTMELRKKKAELLLDAHNLQLFMDNQIALANAD